MPSTPGLLNLRLALDSLHPLSEPAWQAVQALARPLRSSPGQHLLQSGDRATEVFFLVEGLLREYYVDGGGHEATRRFCSAGALSGSLADLLQPGAAAAAIEVLAPSRVLALPWAQVDALAEQHPSLMKLLRRLAETLYVQKMQREFEMLTLPASERYQRFARQHADLDDRLPRHLVASYLGITPVHLSRIAGGKPRPVTARPAEKS